MEGPPDHDVPIMHCTQCVRALAPQSHFCPHCGMPLTAYATTGPLEQVWALGWLVNRLLDERHPSSLVVAGTWLMSVPAVLALLAFLVAVAVQPHILSEAIFQIPMVLIGACHVLLVARVTKAFFAARVGPGPYSARAE